MDMIWDSYNSTRMKVSIVLLFVLASVAMASFGVDMSTLTTLDNLKCLRSNYSTNFLAMRAYRSYGAIDPNAKAMIKLAKEAGIDFVDVYMFPCPTKDPIVQADELLAEIKGSTYTYVWVDVEDNYNPQCNWTTLSYNESCEYVQKLVKYLESKDQNVGIYASKYMWNLIMGDPQACPRLSDRPLWYAHYDGKESFDDFVPFGGWTVPTQKQYKGTTTICNAEVDFNWYPMCSGKRCLNLKVE